MTTIHDQDPGSRIHELDIALQAAGNLSERLGARVDELESVLAAARLGFARLHRAAAGGPRDELAADARFKAEFGLAPDCTCGLSEWLQSVDRGDRQPLAAAIASAFAAGVQIDITVRTAGAGGTTQSICLAGRVVNGADGQPEGLIITSRNVTSHGIADTERSALLEQERSRREVAEAQARTHEEFLCLVSHELRSPLNAILGWNRILGIKRAQDAEVAAIVARIEHSAKVQLKLVNDLLDVARVGTGKLHIQLRPVKLAQIVAAAIEQVRLAAQRRQIDLVAQIEADPGTRGDPERLQQVVANLLANAIRFTPQSGRIRVALRASAGCMQLSVTDNGQGIAPQQLPQIFNRCRAPSGGGSVGLGVGLAVVKEIVRLHGGSVSASSAGVGCGSTFTVVLPIVTTPQRPSAPLMGPSLASGHSLGGLSILVVDDELDARTVVAESLRLEGAQVTVTDSAVGAFEQLQVQGAHFDVVVSDIGMPDEDGYALIRRLRAMQPGRHTVAIAVTGYVSAGDVEAAMEAGFDLHVPKPLDFDTFVPLVRRLADGADLRVEDRNS